jgi:hypothetical protein
MNDKIRFRPITAAPTSDEVLDVMPKSPTEAKGKGGRSISLD